MIEKPVPEIKFDIDRKYQQANVIHNEVPNLQNENWCNTENFTCFLQRVTCNKTRTTFVRTTALVLECNSLLLAIKISYQKQVSKRFIHSHQLG